MGLHRGFDGVRQPGGATSGGHVFVRNNPIADLRWLFFLPKPQDLRGWALGSNRLGMERFCGFVFRYV